ncbi:hypothetical protein ACFL41_01365 [Gemmatimonadota bacterium]
MSSSYWKYIAYILCLFLAQPGDVMAQHRVVLSEIDGAPLVRTEGGPKYDGALFAVEENFISGFGRGEPGWQRFNSIPGILVAPDGKMVLTDSRKCAIYILTRDGELIIQMGGSGSEPGEFRQLDKIMWVVQGGSFLVFDNALNRATRFSISGELIDTELFMADMRDRVMRCIPLGDDRYLERTRTASGRRVVGQPVNEIVQFWFLNSRFEADSNPIELTVQTHFAISSSARGQIPYTRDPEIVPFPDGRLLLSNPDNNRLVVLSSAGDPMLYIERDWDRPGLSIDDIREGRRPWVEDDRSWIQEFADQIPFPNRHTAYSRAFPDDRGRIWVEYVDGPTPATVSTDYCRYDIFGPDGVWLGIQEFDFYPWLISGDHVYRRLDIEAEGPGIRRYSLRPLVPEAAGVIRR